MIISPLNCGNTLEKSWPLLSLYVELIQINAFPPLAEDAPIKNSSCPPVPLICLAPKLISIPDSIEEFSQLLWNNLNSDNKVSLFIRFINLETGKYESKIINKNC